MMLTKEMQNLITDHRAGMVATINDNGSPSVSPKATFVIIDSTTLAFGNIRSPGTISNLEARSTLEICFIDVVLRKAVRVSGTARIQKKLDADEHIRKIFEASWSDYISVMSDFVVIDIARTEWILSPAYDLGTTEDELKMANMERLKALYPT